MSLRRKEREHISSTDKAKDSMKLVPNSSLMHALCLEVCGDSSRPAFFVVVAANLAPKGSLLQTLGLFNPQRICDRRSLRRGCFFFSTQYLRQRGPGTWDFAEQNIQRKWGRGCRFINTKMTLLATMSRVEEVREALLLTLDRAILIDERVTSRGQESGPGIPEGWVWNGRVKSSVKRRDLRGALSVLSSMKMGGLRPDVATFAMIGRLCIELDRWDHLVRLRKEMEETGIVANTIFFNTLMSAMLRKTRYDEIFELKDELLSRGLELNVFSYSILMAASTRSGQLDRALQIYSDMVSTQVVADEHIYGCLADVFARKGDLDAAYSVIQSMRADGIAPTNVVYGTLIDAYTRQNQYAKVDMLLKEMKANNVRPNTFVFKSILEGRLKHGSDDEVRSALESLTEYGVTPDLTTFLTMAKAYSRLGDMHRLEEIENKIMTSPQVRDCYPFSVIMDVWNKLGNIEACDRVWEGMLSLGLQPESGVCSNYIDALCKAGRLDKGLLLFADMLRSDTLPNVSLWSILIDHISKTGDNIRALEMFGMMKAMSVIPNVVTYSTMLRVAGALKNIDLLEELLREMDVSDIEKDEWVYNCVLGVYGKAGMTDRVLQVFEEMKGLPNVKPSMRTYTIVMNALCKLGQLEEAESLFGKARAEGLEPDPIAYSVLVDGLAKAGRVAEAITVTRSAAATKGMTKSNLRFLYSSILGSYTAQGQEAGALKVVDEMKARGVGLDSVTCNQLIDMYLHKLGDVDQALKVFQGMLDDNIPPDVLTYTLLISGLCELGALHKALDMGDLFLREGIRPNIGIVNQLLQAALQVDSDEYIAKIGGAIDRYNLKADMHTYSALLNHFAKRGNTEMVFQLGQEAQSRGIQLDTALFNIMLEAAVRADQWDRAMSVLDSMDAADIPRDEFTYTILATYAAKRGDVEGALDWKAEMESKEMDGVGHNPVLFLSLMRDFRSHGHMEAANQIRDEARERGFIVDYDGPSPSPPLK